MLHGHGGNISAVARRFGLEPSEIIDMSSNMIPQTVFIIDESYLPFVIEAEKESMVNS